MSIEELEQPIIHVEWYFQSGVDYQDWMFSTKFNSWWSSVVTILVDRFRLISAWRSRSTQAHTKKTLKQQANYRTGELFGSQRLLLRRNSSAMWYESSDHSLGVNFELIIDRNVMADDIGNYVCQLTGARESYKSR